MFKPCPKCGFLVALIGGREASQRCPRCGSALVTEGELLEMDAAAPKASERAQPEAANAAPVENRTTADTSAREPAPTDDAAPTPRIHAAIHPGHPKAVGQERGVADASQPSDSARPDPEPAAAPHDGPSFARRHARRRSGRPRWPWVVGLATLSLLLALQLLLAQRVELARDAAWRPLVMRACSVLRCAVPAWHEPQAFAMLARGVRPSGTRSGVLHVNATVRNDARWPQAPPVVVLSLSDVDGRVVGARAVTPPEYGRGGDAAIAPGDSVDIAFDVREPATHVESFDFQLQ